MPLDVTPGAIEVPERNESRDSFTQDYKLRQPLADVGPGTQPFVDGSLVADAMVPVYNDALVIGRGGNLRTSAGVWLRETGAAEGVFPRPAVGASGYATIDASSGGGLIQAGTEVRYVPGGLRYRVTTTAIYVAGDVVPLQGFDTGPSTNLAPGTVLQFTSPPPGIGPSATVFEQSDGSGLSGGRAADDDEALRRLISDRRANPPASGNDAEYQARIKATPGLSVQQPFTIPGVFGPGTMAFCFTLNPAAPGASRVPNGVQVAAAYSYIVGQEPGDDSIFGADIEESPLAVALGITWGVGAVGWADVTPWPAWIAGDPVVVDASPAPSATSFTAITATSTTTPQVGQTVGVYDAAEGVIRNKRIGAVAVLTANKRWTLTIDTTNNASDVSSIPVAGQIVSPWAGSIQSLVAPVVSYFDTLGPGEQFASLPDPGLRQRRQPPSPQYWPSVVGNKMLIPIFKTPGIANAEILSPDGPYPTPVGTPGVLSYLVTLGDLAAFPQV